MVGAMELAGVAGKGGRMERCVLRVVLCDRQGMPVEGVDTEGCGARVPTVDATDTRLPKGVSSSAAGEWLGVLGKGVQAAAEVMRKEGVIWLSPSLSASPQSLCVVGAPGHVMGGGCLSKRRQGQSGG